VPQQLTVKGQSRLADHGPGVPDEAADHDDEQQLAALILWIATTSLLNRLNATIGEPAGATWG
jgi:alkylhydroperoxidase family enzyme